MAEGIPYKGHTINPKPQSSPDGKWRPKAEIFLWTEGNPARQMNIFDGDDTVCDTKEEATDISIRCARAAIDKGLDWKE